MKTTESINPFTKVNRYQYNHVGQCGGLYVIRAGNRVGNWSVVVYVDGNKMNYEDKNIRDLPDVTSLKWVKAQVKADDTQRLELGLYYDYVERVY